MITAALFVVAAAAGAVGRAEAGRRWNRSGMPLGILLVNVTGSFVLGLLWDTAPPSITVLGVGGLGAFTTFSSFARDVVALTERKQLLEAVAYAVATYVGGIGAAAVGITLVT